MAGCEGFVRVGVLVVGVSGCGMVWRCGDEDDILVRNILRIIISDEDEVEWGGVGGV